MDPNTALAEMRRALRDGDDTTAAERADALDQWITNGGFLPADWQRTSGL